MFNSNGNNTSWNEDRGEDEEEDEEEYAEEMSLLSLPAVSPQDVGQLLLHLGHQLVFRAVPAPPGGQRCPKAALCSGGAPMKQPSTQTDVYLWHSLPSVKLIWDQYFTQSLAHLSLPSSVTLIWDQPWLKVLYAAPM